MIKNYFKIAWRSLVTSRLVSFINIAGLAVGMAVAMLIGLWVWDEVSFDRQCGNYDRVAQVMENQYINGSYGTQKQLPIPVASGLSAKFGSNFKRVVLSSMTGDHILAVGDKKLTTAGNFIQPQGLDMFGLPMLEGSRSGLKDQHSILLSGSLAKALFAGADPVGKTIRMDDSLTLKVTGVYQDFAYNSTFRDVSFLSPWDLYVYADPETRGNQQEWEDNNWQVFVQLADRADFDKVSEKIKYIKADNDKYVKSTDKFKPTMFLFPMSRWHLYSGFTNGVSTGGRIQYVRLFGLIGVFVLFLACINFMNLSTARSEKRAREVGIRKTMGSRRGQLIVQFFSESLLVTMLAFVCTLLLVLVALPVFNSLADKKIVLPWGNPFFWLSGLAFCLFTGLIAGSYPALYLSAFQPVRVLKGVFRAGRLAENFVGAASPRSFLVRNIRALSAPLLSRKVLVVTQFTVSIALIAGTMIVLQQIKFAQDRPVGYSREGLVTIQMHTKDIYNHFEAFRSDLLKTGVVVGAAESTSPTTEMGDQNGGLSWTGKDPNATSDNFAMKGVTQEYAKTVGMQFSEGRDFQTGPTGFDAMTMLLSESSVKRMGLKKPIGATVVWSGYKFTVLGVVKDMVMESPYETPIPTIYYIAPYPIYTVTIRINPNVSAAEALGKIGAVFSTYSPAEPFDYKFVDQAYDAKFRGEQRVGELGGFFAILAVFISCLGLFGLASFVAEQRTKEIGVRKVLGASVFNLWKMVSKDFVVLVAVSCLIAIPIAQNFLHQWLQQFPYRTEISWWIFAGTVLGALVITLMTVSYQALKAANGNPVKSLRAE